MNKLMLFLYLILSGLPAFSLDSAIPFQPVTNQPYFATPQLNIDSMEDNTIILKIDAKQNGTGRLFWATHYDPQFNQQKNLWFFIKPGVHDYYFNVPSQNPNWIGWIRGFIFLPEINPADIKSVEAKVEPSNLALLIRSGWQEFWGPKGRLVIGSTINTIQSTNLFGQSIMFYIYWFLAIWALGCTILLLIQQKFNWQQLGKLVVFAVLVCCILLEISSLFNNWLMFKGDLKYFGKSAQDKLIMANIGDFYPFIEFCRANIPINAKFDIRIPPIYNDIKAVYYLYPRQRSTLEADYLVVYDQPNELNFTVWKTFRPGALIMRAKR